MVPTCVNTVREKEGIKIQSRKPKTLRMLLASTDRIPDKETAAVDDMWRSLLTWIAVKESSDKQTRKVHRHKGCWRGRDPSARSRCDYKTSRTSSVTKPVTTSSNAWKYQSVPLPPTRESSSPASFSTFTFVFKETAGAPTPARRLLMRVA